MGAGAFLQGFVGDVIAVSVRLLLGKFFQFLFRFQIGRLLLLFFMVKFQLKVYIFFAGILHDDRCVIEDPLFF